MLVKKRISLDADKSLGYGHLLKCCERYQPVNINELDFGDVWNCSICNKPLMINIDGDFYLIGENVTI